MPVPIGPDLWLAVLVCRLMVATHMFYVITCITTYLPIQERWKAELAWLVDP